MDTFAATCEAVAATRKKTEKTRIVAEYLRSLGPEMAPRAAQFLAGQVFPAWEERTATWRSATVAGHGGDHRQERA